MAAMKGKHVTVQLNPGLINPYLAQVGGLSAKRAAQKTAARANSNVRAAGRVNTGRLASSYTVRQARSALGRYISAWEVFSPLAYAVFQEDGIGPVKAKPGHVLRFQPKGSAVFIFRPRTKGFRGAHQLGDAYRAITLNDFLP